MNKYRVQEVIGEGAYGVVLKCIDTATGGIVAIKRFKHTEDAVIHRNTLRELKMLKALRHPNIVRLLEAFRRKKKLVMVFEFVDGNLLELLDAHSNGLPTDQMLSLTFQMLLGLHWCHRHNILHRDIKPENLLVSADGVLKLCDFGFSRRLAAAGDEEHTMYVATRWYRSPELLAGADYGPGMDLWAAACIMGEMADGQPVFPGESDLDQLHVIQRSLGPIPGKLRSALARNTSMRHAKILPATRKFCLRERYRNVIAQPVLELMLDMLQLDPDLRPSAAEAKAHRIFLPYSQLIPEGQSCVGASSTIARQSHSRSPEQHDSQLTSAANNDITMDNRRVTTSPSINVNELPASKRQNRLPIALADATITTKPAELKFRRVSHPTPASSATVSRGSSASSVSLPEPVTFRRSFSRDSPDASMVDTQILTSTMLASSILPREQNKNSPSTTMLNSSRSFARVHAPSFGTKQQQRSESKGKGFRQSEALRKPLVNRVPQGIKPPKRRTSCSNNESQSPLYKFPDVSQRPSSSSQSVAAQHAVRRAAKAASSKPS
eukprot:TRINITY_DN11217_c0_g4_i1.p1 TRINITY_DN11217_c0_g4~~TRINITY_DN11217_c0_g4_i1.p1  ORF type:complete len:551 (+),score=66.58 TRINITY_DN11217_c0_g4_i1:142-1794(+)